MLSGLTTAAAATGFGPATSAFAATTAQVNLNFENGSLGAPITKHIGATLGSTYAHTGNYGCRLKPTAATNNVACIDLDQSGFALHKPYATFTMFFRLVTLPKPSDSYMNLFEIGNTSTAASKSQFTVFFRNNRLVCDFGYAETMDIAAVPAVGGWHKIQVIVNYGATTYTAHVKYDGGTTKTLTSANNKTVQNVKVLWIHYPATAVDYTMDVDDIQMATSDTLPSFLYPASGRVGTNTVTAWSESFDSGALGTRPTSANTHYDQSIGNRGGGDGSVVAVFAAGGVRDQCVRFYNTRVTPSSFGLLGKRVNVQRVIYLRRYYKLDVRPSHRMSVLLYKWGGTGNGQLGGTHNGSFAFGGAAQSHKFTLVDKNVNSTLSRSTVPLNAWFRVELKLDFTSDTAVQTAHLFLGRNLNGTTPSETLRAHLAGSYTDYIEDGILTNPGVKVNVRVDQAVNGTDWPGPTQ